MKREELAQKLESMKGLSGSGTVLSETIKKIADYVGTMEPGDLIAGTNVSAVPIAYDAWYLFYHQNMMKKYYIDVAGADFNHYKYDTYLSQNLSFMDYLTGLKPLKVLPDIKQQLTVSPGAISELDLEVIIPSQYKNNGIYWINTIFFELKSKDLSIQFSSEGSKGYKSNPNNYIGYLALPIGQLGVMEVISLVQETELSGYAFAVVDSLDTYHKKEAPPSLADKDKPSLQPTPEMFPDAKNANGNILSGQNYCYGRKLIEDAYNKPGACVKSQNIINSEGTTAYAPVAELDVELWAKNIKDYGEEIKPKLWMRYWIHKDSTLPVPGEFLGVLARPSATPPHVWWFQESSPFLYAGNWVETPYLTSGVITAVVPEESRTDGGTGTLYTVKVQGCSIKVNASDYLSYAVGDRVAILKTDSAKQTKTYCSQNQMFFKNSDKDKVFTNYIIIPFTFYKIKH